MSQSFHYISSFNIFLVTSVIESKSRAFFTANERYEQTLETGKNIKSRCPSSFTVLIEGSDILSELWIEKLKTVYDSVVIMPKNSDTSHSNISFGELALLRFGLEYISKNISSDQDLSKTKILKCSGRYLLNESFDISEFPEDKYGFAVYTKEEAEIWQSDEYNYITVLYSIPFNKINDFLSCIKSITFDTEHDLYRLIPKGEVKLIKNLNITGRYGGSGKHWYK